MDYSLESFIDFCYDYQISQEGFGNALKWIKDKLKSMILRLIQFIRKFTSKNKGSGIRYKLDVILKRLENKLTSVDKINTTQEAKKVEEEVAEIKEEVEKIVGEDDGEFDLLDERELLPNNKDIEVVKRSKYSRSSYYTEYAIYNIDLYKKIKEMIKTMISVKNFNDYIKIFKEFKKLLFLPDKSTVMQIHPQMKKYNDEKIGYLELVYILEDSRPMKRNINDILYHTSKNPNLKSITPRWISELDYDDETGGLYYYSARFFDTPRAFFGVKPMNRLGGKIDGQDLYIYKAEGIKNAFIDIDGIKYGTSVYVEGFSNIPLTRIDNI